MPDVAGETVADVAGLYLGNILYALELAALTLEQQGKREDAAFYRGIGRALADARGGEQGAVGGEPGAGNRDRGMPTS